jgi:hypothetical protein
MMPSFSARDKFWQDVLAFLRRCATKDDRILAPKDFLDAHPGVFGYGIQYAFPLRFFSLVVLHKGMYDYFPLEVLEELRARFVPIFANEVFVVFADRPRKGAVYFPDVHYKAFTIAIGDLRRCEHREVSCGDSKDTAFCGVVVTTYNRPHALSRSLPQICRAGAPVLVVDDGTTGEGGAWNRDTAAACGADYLLLPGNRGLPVALNVGISYWLGDPQVAWISCFQDDVDVHPSIFAHLEKVQEPTVRPILTGRLSGRHPTYGRECVGGEEIILMRGISGQHIHAHRDYWRGVLPIPSPYLGAPRPGGGLAGQGPEEDFWISVWSPDSISKKGGYVACLPGLVRAFLTSAEDSTWERDLGEQDGPLRETGEGSDAR